MAITYTIDEKNAVRIFNSETNADLPFIFQDVKPNGADWTDKAEATAWAEAFIEEYTKPASTEEPAPVEEPSV